MRTIPTSFIQQSVPGSYYPRSNLSLGDLADSKEDQSIYQEFYGPNYKHRTREVSFPRSNVAKSADFPEANSDFASNSLNFGEKDTRSYHNGGKDSIQARVNPSGHRGYSYLVEDPEPKIYGHKQAWHYDSSERRQESSPHRRPDYKRKHKYQNRHQSNGQHHRSNGFHRHRPDRFSKHRPSYKRDRLPGSEGGYSRRPPNTNRRLDYEQHYGQFGSGHKSKHCCQKVFETEWFLALLAVIGVGTIIVARAIAANLRKKRSFNTFDWCLQGCDFSLTEYVLSGTL